MGNESGTPINQTLGKVLQFDGEKVFSIDGTDVTEAVKEKLGVNDKASLSGADFVDMPFVNGDALIESDSNSLGEWVRSADGSQFQSRVVDIDLATGNSQVFDSAINSVSRDWVGWCSNAAVSNTGIRSSLANTYVRRRGLNTDLWEIRVDNNTVNVVSIALYAKTRWK